MREVRCLSDDMMSSEGCDEQLKPADKEDCNPEPCIPHIGQSSPNIPFGILLTFPNDFSILMNARYFVVTVMSSWGTPGMRQR